MNKVHEEDQYHINIYECMTDLNDGKLSYKDYVVNVDKKPNNWIMIVNKLFPNKL